MEEVEGLAEDEVYHPDILEEMTGNELHSEQMVPGTSVKDEGVPHPVSVLGVKGECHNHDCNGVRDTLWEEAQAVRGATTGCLRHSTSPVFFQRRHCPPSVWDLQ